MFRIPMKHKLHLADFRDPGTTDLLVPPGNKVAYSASVKGNFCRSTLHHFFSIYKIVPHPILTRKNTPQKSHKSFLTIPFDKKYLIYQVFVQSHLFLLCMPVVPRGESDV